MTGKIDEKDKAVIYYLDLDARQPVSRLARKVRLNRRVVCYRIERLVKTGMIQKFLMFVNIPKAGYVVTTFFARFRDAQPKDEEAVIDYLRKSRKVMWLASMDGRFNIGFTMCTRNINEVTDFFDEFRDLHGRFLSDIQMANVVFAWRFPRKYLLGSAPLKKKIPFVDPPLDRADLDLIDKRILAALGEDGRMRAVDIAKRVGISADAVADRIKKLEQGGIIAGIGVFLDNLVLNRRLFRTFITFHNLSKVKDKFLKYCYEHPNAIQVKRMLGPWEWEVDLEVQDETELRRINAEFKEHFKDAVSSTSFVTLYKTHKFDLGGFLLE